MSPRVFLRILGPVVLGFMALAAAPGASLASCIPPQFQTFADAADTVVIDGGIVAVEPTRVIVDAARWWGDEPRQRVSIDRTPADPTIISSVDWNPQPSERWVIIAKRDGGRLVTGVCEQMPADQLVLGEVVSSLGEGVVPQPATGPASDTGPSPVLVAVVLTAGAALIIGLALTRRRAREAD